MEGSAGDLLIDWQAWHMRLWTKGERHTIHIYSTYTNCTYTTHKNAHTLYTHRYAHKSGRDEGRFPTSASGLYTHTTCTIKVVILNREWCSPMGHLGNRGTWVFVGGQPGLHSKFQASQSYIVRTCLKFFKIKSECRGPAASASQQ